MRRIHIPNMFFIQGQAHQGKSSLTRFFRQSLDCEVLSTDQLFWRWCEKYHRKETRKVRASMGRYFPHMSSALRREWFEYLVNYALAITKYARPDMVIEGWLLTLLPKDLKEILHSRCTILNVTMRHFVANTSSKKKLTPNGTDYTNVVAGLKVRLRADKERELMLRVRHQRYEDCKSCAGRSDTAGRLAAFGLPKDLTGKTVLELNCNTGYFSIRLAQRGARVWAVDTDEALVKLASRIANAIYRLPYIRFYHGDILVDDFNKPRKFDYVVIANGVNNHESPDRLFARAKQLLAPGGRILAEIVLPRLDDGNPDKVRVPFFKEVIVKTRKLLCPNELTVQSWFAPELSVHRSIHSVPTASSLLTRVAYTFGDAHGLDNGRDNDNIDVPDRAEDKMGLVASVLEPGDVDSANSDAAAMGIVAGLSNTDCDEYAELFALEKT